MEWSEEAHQRVPAPAIQFPNHKVGRPEALFDRLSLAEELWTHANRELPRS